PPRKGGKGAGGFASLFSLDYNSRLFAKNYRHPVLVTCTDGVGSKLKIAGMVGKHDTVGIDLVAMVVDDVVVTGAEPLFVLDYLAVGRVDPERVAAIVGGVADGCRLAGCALLGGETAEHPDAMAPDAYDLAGFAVGLVERDRLLGPVRVVAGDALLGLAASGLHANGFSLARQVLASAGIGYERELPELGRPIGEALLTPTRIYAPHLVDLAAAGVELHALCHVTGGGLPGNLPRCLPPGLTARVDRSAWEPPALFRLLGELGPVEDEELARATNLGVGMVAILPAAEADRAAGFLAAREIPSWVMGEVVAGGE
ncbi:MAG TPA: phosphoribosylformylglycinamidine cyclo-ligase, partial [Actinomycetes bacterium]|nr:phosphoribosylformylglycinamidine cyclo-ligase [Actinomycetes bacterium]